jgi:aquaporin Z
MKKYLAEFIGTLALVFCGTGAVIVDQQSGGSLGLFGIAATFGIIVTTMIYIFGSISGTHINPAVTISLAIGKLMPKNDVLGYLIAQILGAIVASSFLVLLFPNNDSLGGTIPSGNLVQSFSIEFILTFFLMLTILAVTAKKETAIIAGLIIGIIVTGIILFAGPISGGSFNPARSIAPALISGNLTALWVYLIAPVLGAIVAMFVWRIFYKTSLQETVK